MFITNEKVPVMLSGDLDKPPEQRNIIYIKNKMDLGTKNKVMDAVAQIGGAGGAMAIRANIGSYNMALMIHNIVGWEGPKFAGVPCDARSIQRLDPNEPLVQLVMAEIAERNPVNRPASADPNASTSAGAPS